MELLLSVRALLMQVGINITGRSKRVFYPNLQVARLKKDGETIKIKACTACIKAGKTLVV
ncbi:MAG: bL28 family ribosomal protein [Bacillota bacterium]